MIDRFRTALDAATAPLMLDAALGTRLTARGLRLGCDDPALWNLSRPALVADLHRRDLQAGATILLTNTFGANRFWLDRFGRADAIETVNRRAVELARLEAEAAPGAERYVVGSIGPTALGDAGSVLEQARLLVEAGVDALLFETFQFAQAERALEAVAPHVSKALLVSLLDWPAPLAPAVQRLAERGAAAVGVNCVIGMEPAVQVARALRAVTSLPLIVKPSAGLPGAIGSTPASFAAAAPALSLLAPILVGGCCGTDESYLAALAHAWYHQPRSNRPVQADGGGQPAEEGGVERSETL